MEEKDLPLAAALLELYPSGQWAIGMSWKSLDWRGDPADLPDKDKVFEKAKEILAQQPWDALRKERDRRMKEVDWVTLRSVRTGEPIPEAWKTYMQALADITKTQTPVIQDGVLEGVKWPLKPE